MKRQSWPLSLARVGETFYFAGHSQTTWKLIEDNHAQQLLSIHNTINGADRKISYEDADKYRIVFYSIITDSRITAI